MAKKQTGWKTKGMNRDLSVSAFNPEFTFENMNLRLSTNDGNTLLSWVNEKGTTAISIVPRMWDTERPDLGMCEAEILGSPIGTAVLNNTLVLFTHEDASTDRIYTIRYENPSVPSVKARLIYHGDLNMDTEHPLETLVSYESEKIQKVYWVDGKNQPRVINITVDGIQDKPNTFFDFIPTLQLNESVVVKKILGGNGIFAPGVIQYAFTYYNKYGQESNIFHTTPLYYISYKDRGASPEDKVDNAFKITVSNVDKNFDYLRIYSIQRTSINGTPICKRIQDIDIQNLKDSSGNPTSTASYTDTGTSGDSVDPTELLYKGGEAIIPYTIEQKDGTLFLGNFKNSRSNLNDLKDTIKGSIAVVSEENSTPLTRDIFATESLTGENYYYASQLTAFSDSAKTTSVPCGGFKRGDYYRCGVQFQHETGKWSEPIYIDDVQVNGTPSTFSVTIDGDTYNNGVRLPILKGTLTNTSDDIITNLTNLGYKKVRPVVVFPDIKDRITLCQGVVNPTVFTQSNRDNNSLYAQASWFFRPYWFETNLTDADGTVYPARNTPHYGLDSKPYLSYMTWDFENETEDDYDASNIRQIEVQGVFADNNKFRIDPAFLTFNSPDLEFDTQLQTTSFGGVNYSRVGDVLFSKTLSAIDIQTESPGIKTIESIIKKTFVENGAYGITSGLFYDDFIVDDNADKEFESYSKEGSSAKWMVYLWNKSGSLNNDINRPSDKGTPSAILKKKIVSNLRYTSTTWLNPTEASPLSVDPQLYMSDQTDIVKVNDKIYQGNIDSMLVPDKYIGMFFAYGDSSSGDSDDLEDTITTPFTSTTWWKTFSTDLKISNRSAYGLKKKVSDPSEKWKVFTVDVPPTPKYKVGDYYIDLVTKMDGVRIKYKSTPHLVISDGNVIDDEQDKLPVVEIQNKFTYVDNKPVGIFGGTSTDALKENNWVPCGEAVSLYDGNDVAASVAFYYSYGDTYYQRWDCLKTYPFTREDPNQVVEIGSFMLETHTNIDGRYDRNRGQVNNTYMSPVNFNLLNPIYSQIDNFFTYKILDDSYYDNTKFLNQITWSKTKEAGADVDLWTNITLASILELDGDKGELNKLVRFNNFLFAFQDTGISQILYNDNVQIQSTQGVPIEIANSGKVSGKDYKSGSIGCSNKWSMVTTPNGIYFMDSNDKSIYLFNGQLANISSAGGFNSWCKMSIPSSDVKWTPSGFDAFVGYYDKLNQDVLFINKEIALAWSEKVQAFTSFYDYGHTPFFCNLMDTGIWIRNPYQNSSCGLWKHQGGEYCKFFDVNKPYWMILVGNPEPQLDKIFTNLEFRACVEGDGEFTQETGKFIPTLPFDYLETWNEYQRGVAFLSNRSAADAFRHNDPNGNASLKRKFRIWRCDIPRNNFERLSGSSFDTTFDYTFRPRSISRKSNDRMRNPWLYLKLMKNAVADGSLSKTEVHDVIMTYFG